MTGLVNSDQNNFNFFIIIYILNIYIYIYSKDTMSLSSRRSFINLTQKVYQIVFKF
jgi:hypothetical protein